MNIINTKIRKLPKKLVAPKGRQYLYLCSKWNTRFNFLFKNVVKILWKLMISKWDRICYTCITLNVMPYLCITPTINVLVCVSEHFLAPDWQMLWICSQQTFILPKLFTNLFLIFNNANHKHRFFHLHHLLWFFYKFVSTKIYLLFKFTIALSLSVTLSNTVSTLLSVFVFLSVFMLFFVFVFYYCCFDLHTDLHMNIYI